ncbi:hypothetical protein Tco_1400898 [Tanacetum coccineum]
MASNITTPESQRFYLKLRDTPFHMKYENEICNEKPEFDQKLVNVVCGEMMKMFTWKEVETIYGVSVGEVLPTTIVYGEDILLTGNSVKDIHATNLALDKKFTIKDLGKYILDLLKDARLIAEKAASSPLPQNLKISLDKGDALTSSGIMIKALGHNQHSFLIDRLGFTSAPT